METITISLICVTRGRYSELDRLLNSLSNQTCKNFEVVLIDQNDGDLLTPLIERYKLHLSINQIRITLSGVSEARNFALKHVKGNWIGFPDDDCWAPPNLIENLTKKIKTTPAIDGLYINWIDPTQDQPIRMFTLTPGLLEFGEAFTMASSICIYIKSNSLYAVNGFNEKIGLGKDTMVKAGEDQDILLRLLSVNTKVLKCSDIQIYHPIGKREWNNSFLTRIQGQGACDLYFYRKYYGKLKASKLLLYWVVSMFYNLFRFNKKNYLWYFYKIRGGIFYSSKI